VFEKHRASQGHSELPILLKGLPAAASALAICVGVLVLAGWFFDLEVLKRVLHGFAAMNPATAISFTVAGFALAASIRQNQAEAGRRLATTLSAIVLFIGLAKLIGIAANWHPNIDEWLFALKVTAAEREMPNRMAPNTALNFVLVGLSLLTLDVSTRRFSPSQAFAILAGFGALLPITGYVYGVQSFRGFASFIPMALNTAITFLILTAGLFFARPATPLAQLFATREPPGVMARRLFPLAVLLTLVLGWLCVWGERHGIFETAFGTALLAITLSVLFVILVTWTIWTVSNLELERVASAQKQSALQLQLQREEMAHHNRVSLMGEMTASFAHELTQPLTAIANSVSAARRFLERGKMDPPLLLQLLQDMAADGQRARDVVLGIRSLVRKDTSVYTRLNLNSVITDTVHLVAMDVLARESTVETELDPHLPDVNASLVQVQQVLLNLIVNALDAMEGLRPAERRIIISTRSDKGSVAKITVRDFGTGLPKDRADKVFDHFFSTKQKGMGMGLVIVRSIIEAHGGTITAENAPDRGARFIARLPALRGDTQTMAVA
jgi:signal transduction histidine kinase